MNCKPGELAIVAGTDTRRHLLGLIVKVERSEMFMGIPHWRTDPPYWDTDYVEVWFADEDLRPIRDPGTDARDETLSWKPVPKEDNLSKEDAELLIEALRQWAKEQA